MGTRRWSLSHWKVSTVVVVVVVVEERSQSRLGLVHDVRRGIDRRAFISAERS